MSEIRSKMYIGLHAKYSLFFWYFNEIWTFSTDIRAADPTILRRVLKENSQTRPRRL